MTIDFLIGWIMGTVVEAILMCFFLSKNINSSI
jgi:hypothetical protein